MRRPTTKGKEPSQGDDNDIHFFRRIYLISTVEIPYPVVRDLARDLFLFLPCLLSVGSRAHYLMFVRHVVETGGFMLAVSPSI